MRSILQVLFGLLLTGYIVWFARRTYRNPDPQSSPWHCGYILPPFRWTTARLRGFSVFWIFAAVLIFGASLIQLASPSWRPPIGPFLAVVLVVTFLLVPRRPKPPQR